MRLASFLLATVAPAALLAQAPVKRPIVAGDLYRIKDVGTPEISPDGGWVLYTVATPDSAKDRTDIDVWMAAWDGSATIRLTSSPEAESAPRWSPDGRYVSFLSARQGGPGAQVWLLDRAGGEASKATNLPGGVEDYAWAPDGKHLVVVARDADTVKAEPGALPKPIVVDRWSFKQDFVGYLGKKRSHLYLFDLATRTASALTSGEFDELVPAWSPDGRSIAFESKRGTPDRSFQWSLFMVDARPGATPRQLATFTGWGGTPSRAAGPVWSPDGQNIAFVIGGELTSWQYNNARLAVIPAAGGSPRVLTAKLDRQAYAPRWTPDGGGLMALLEDDRVVHAATVRLDGTLTRLTNGPIVVSGLSVSGNRVALTVSSDTEPAELMAVESGRLRRLTHHNDSLLSVLQLAQVDEFSSTSKDGTVVNGLLYRPPDGRGRRLPFVVWIHGGPFGQNQHDFDPRRQAAALQGFAVLGLNYRGSSGRGEGFAKAIAADWGNKEVIDVHGAVDHAVAQGIADPDRLGVGGWSYGGILTDYLIASDHRFKAAVAGAGNANWLTMYGVDQFVALYENELGSPWSHLDTWLKVSYPFLHADRITTPTLFMGGERDINVPIVGGEQMYQALRTLGVATELVVYPGMYHGPTRPSYRVDIVERFIAWWRKYLGPAGG